MSNENMYIWLDLPKDEDGTVPKSINLIFRPKD